MGRAYAFFDCGASKEEINEELPFIRKAVKTPEKLELSLSEGIDELGLDGKLKDIAENEDRQYTLCANYLSTNEKTADELAGILNQVYQSPLNEDGQFKGAIVQGDWGMYHSRF
ncbi:hypothetical protein HOE04_01590 [archaeon]|jgi:hypothetical protein|nr:hypothetical protein [archaeon]